MGSFQISLEKDLSSSPRKNTLRFAEQKEYRIFSLLYFYELLEQEGFSFLSRNCRTTRGAYSQKIWVEVCGPLPKTLTLFMTSLQANLRPKSAISPTLFMTYL